MFNKTLGNIFIAAIVSMSSPAHGVEPFDNIVAPDGSYLLLYPSYYTADKLVDSDGNSVNDGLGLRAATNVFRYSYAGTVEQNNGKWLATVLLPLATVEVNGEEDHGVGDITLGSAYWLVNQPASRTWLVVAGFVDTPTGHYDAEHAANVGSNVWKYRPVIGFARQFGKYDLELTYRYNIYTRNDSTGFRSGNESIFETYLGYSVSPRIMLGAHVNYIDGDDSNQDGQTVAGSAVRKYQLGPSINWMYGKTSGLTVVWLADQKNENGPEGDLLLMRLSWSL